MRRAVRGGSPAKNGKEWFYVGGEKHGRSRKMKRVVRDGSPEKPKGECSMFRNEIELVREAVGR